MGIWVVKTTLEIDDELYREAKAVAALSGRKMKDLVAEGLRTILRPAPHSAADASRESAAVRLQHCFSLADEMMKSTATGPSARELLTEDRNRSEKHE
jgi:hypothetical protein